MLNVKRQLNQGNHDADHEVASHQHFSAGRSLHDLPINLSISRKAIETIAATGKTKKVIGPNQYSVSERKLRANAFAARVNSLKYYIGLIGANAVI